MNKFRFTLFGILLSGVMFGQIPSGYYDGTEGLTGYDLKTKLFYIIRDFNVQSYAALKGLYQSNSSKNGFKDKYYENDNTVLDIYSENPDGPDPYNFNPNDPMGSGGSEGDAFNREHLIPQSYFNEELPMRTDAFHIWPTDSKVNGWRDNFAFGTVTNGSSATPCNSGATNMPCKTKNGSLKGKFIKNNSITVFEPIDEFKGDVARAYFYFATCYQDKMTGFYNSSNAGVKAMFDGTFTQVFSQDFLEMLIQWHVMDPVSQREQDINDLIYYNHQGNRNPYIDHPEFVQIIWGSGMDVNDIDYQKRNDVLVYNSSKNEVTLKLQNPEKSIEKISVYDLNGRPVKTIQNSNGQDQVKISLFSKGVYIIKAEGKRLEFNTKAVIK